MAIMVTAARACANRGSRARSDRPGSRSDLGVSKACFILVGLILASPALLLRDGVIVQAVVTGIVAVALAVVGRSLRPRETEFLFSTIRFVVAAAAIPALWMLFQVLPLGVFAHPIWASLQSGLGRPVTGAISIDPGAGIIALGQYLTVIAVGVVAAAVAVDRERAEWILFALTAAGAVMALILLTNELVGFAGFVFTTFMRAPAIDGAALGAIFAAAACVRTIERYETRHASPSRSVAVLRRTFVACCGAFALCVAALVFDGRGEAPAAAGLGLAAFACVIISRRFRLGAWFALITAVTVGLIVVLAVAYQANRGKSLLLAFAASPAPVSERVLDDARLLGTGVGSYAALSFIYREMDDRQSDVTSSTTAAIVAIELGRPMLWLIVAAAIGYLGFLFRAALRRGRDSFYSATGAGCLLTLLALAWVNAGLLAIPTAVITAAALGLAFAQSKSRTVKS